MRARTQQPRTRVAPPPAPRARELKERVRRTTVGSRGRASWSLLTPTSPRGAALSPSISSKCFVMSVLRMPSTAERRNSTKSSLRGARRRQRRGGGLQQWPSGHAREKAPPRQGADERRLWGHENTERDRRMMILEHRSVVVAQGEIGERFHLAHTPCADAPVHGASAHGAAAHLEGVVHARVVNVVAQRSNLQRAQHRVDSSTARPARAPLFSQGRPERPICRRGVTHGAACHTAPHSSPPQGRFCAGASLR